MPSPFPPWSNTAMRVGLVLLAAGGAAAIVMPMIVVRTPYSTGQQYQVDQPVMFDHRHHVQDDGIDCRYCHSTVETSPTAGMPATSVCMGCHSQVWAMSPMLEPVRRSYFSDTPIPWNRVHQLPDFVYFNHAIHVNKGVGCVTCHGRVDEMAKVYQVAPLLMQWCLDCHRDPYPNLRPLDQITSMTWQAPGDREAYGRMLAARNHVRVGLDSCTVCHR